jgi:hypothetical protein
MFRRVARHVPDGGADGRGFPGWVARKGTTARRAPDDSPARGKDSELDTRSCPRVSIQVADFGIEHLLRLAQRKQSEKLARGGQPERRRKTRAGSCSERRGVPYRRKASRIVTSRLFHERREKRSRSNGHHRKPTCKGGGETRGVTRRQRRSREWSETARWTRVDLAAVLKRHDAPGTRANTPPRRRTTRRSGSSTS